MISAMRRLIHIAEGGSSSKQAPPPPKRENIEDAIEHADIYGDRGWTPEDFEMSYVGLLMPAEIGRYDDFSSWVEVQDSSDLDDFRDGMFTGGPDIPFPPIIVITAPDDEGCRTQIGDGRGRVNWAIGHGVPLHVYHMTHKGCGPVG